MATSGTIQRDVLPIPDRKPVSLTTYDARDPDKRFPPVTPFRQPAGAPGCRSHHRRRGAVPARDGAPETGETKFRGICFGSWLLLALSVILIGCAAGPEITRVNEVKASDYGPYRNVLVVSLFESFDMRRYLETELVSQLSAQGVEAVASTSMMDTKTPVNRQTFVEMVEKTGADSVLLTQPVQLESTAKKTTMSPQATYNIRPTYYYNVFSVDLTEYVEPPEIRLEHDVTLLAELIAVESREPVWAIQTRSKVVWKSEMERDYSAYIDEAKAITRQMAKDGIID